MWSINRRTLSPKTHAHLLVDGADGVGEGRPHVEMVELPEDQVHAPSLTDEEIVAIARMARRAEKHYGCPQDIEWAVAESDGAVHLLQSRPETVWAEKDAAAAKVAAPAARPFDHVFNLLGGTKPKPGA